MVISLDFVYILSVWHKQTGAETYMNHFGVIIDQTCVYKQWGILLTNLGIQTLQGDWTKTIGYSC